MAFGDTTTRLGCGWDRTCAVALVVTRLKIRHLQWEASQFNASRRLHSQEASEPSGLADQGHSCCDGRLTGDASCIYCFHSSRVLWDVESFHSLVIAVPTVQRSCEISTCLEMLNGVLEEACKVSFLVYSTIFVTSFLPFRLKDLSRCNYLPLVIFVLRDSLLSDVRGLKLGCGYQQ